MIALLIDIGNTRVKWRTARVVDDGGTGHDTPQWLSEERSVGSTDVGDIEAAFRSTSADPIDHVLIANVASEATGTAVLYAVSAVWPASRARFVRSGASARGLVNAYRDPGQLGVDRWLAAVAAHATCPGGSVLICTFGTATTLDLVERDRFVGGLILPGIDAMHDALITSTARLPTGAGRVVDFGERTADAVAGGVMAAQFGAVERTLRKARDRRPDDDSSAPLCIVAGGGAGRMAALFDELDTPYRVIHDLVLRGLALVSCDDAFAH